MRRYKETELANLRTAFRWAADHGDLDVAATIATYAAWFGFTTENYEPIATDNPYVLSFALLAYGWDSHDVDPVRSLAALRRGLVIAQDSGNRANLSHLASNLCRFEAEHGEPLAAFDYFTMAIGNYHDSGNIYMIRAPLWVLAAFFDRLRRYEPAATIAGGLIADRRGSGTDGCSPVIASLWQIRGRRCACRGAAGRRPPRAS
jgi:hypothetical protein